MEMSGQHHPPPPTLGSVNVQPPNNNKSGNVHTAFA